MQSKLDDETIHDLSITPERDVTIKPIYTTEDLAGIDHLNTMPGQPPYLRGAYATMYTERPWTIRQYAGFGDAQTTNKLYLEAIQNGATGLSVAFDLPTHRGIDSDSAFAEGDVGKAGVAIDSVEDMKILFAGVPLNKVSVSMTMNGAVLPVMASFLVAAEEMGYRFEDLNGTIQNDILKEFMVRNTYIYSPQFSLRVAGDVVEFNSQHVPKFNSMSISGYHFQEAGAGPVLELALTLSNAKTYINYAITKGIDINKYCESLSFFFCVGSNFYLEIAKLRAARVLWSEMLKNLGVSSTKAKALRMHCQTSGWSLVAGDPLNNIARTTAQAMAAAFGGTQSLHTNSYDEAYSLPTTESSKVARDTQRILQSETGICDVIDPWAGSYMMEKLTSDVIVEVKKIFAEIDSMGGMIKALDAKWVQTIIQEKSAETQAKIDSGVKPIIGSQSKPESSTSLDVDSYALRAAQTNKLKVLKLTRNALDVKRALRHISHIGQSGEGNLLAATIEAIKCRATIQECTEALAKANLRFTQAPVLTKQVYGEVMCDSAGWTHCKNIVLEASKLLHRPPRILVTKIGQDGHDRGLNVISTILTDSGCIVKQAPLFTDIKTMIELAIEFDADLIAVSSLANSHNILIPKLMIEVNKKGLSTPIALGGIIPTNHHQALLEVGLSYVMAPGESILGAIPILINLITAHRLLSNEKLQKA
ncbi:MAG TPA: methylmalonyl-CoA mutase [Methylophilus sp.]|uniref:methylmalonyl-CoA mutase n=1 Tax=Methylophilus sp. TaxID=29541 RepID=UPI002BD2D9D6|nr:methylmalonyl-CoA mutase [Methylophilus sp.]HSH88082.1 methylmalonyl-CoA mutase [Methylophilus sp.]